MLVELGLSLLPDPTPVLAERWALVEFSCFKRLPDCVKLPATATNGAVFLIVALPKEIEVGWNN